MLTGHGCFGQFLYRYGKLRTPECGYCDHTEDDAEHTIFRCDFCGESWLLNWETVRAKHDHLVYTPEQRKVGSSKDIRQRDVFDQGRRRKEATGGGNRL